MGFVDHVLLKFLELETENYMTTIRETEDFPIHMVPMEWETVLDKSGLFSLMHMPHFGLKTEVNVCVKLLIVFFHGGCLLLY